MKIEDFAKGNGKVILPPFQSRVADCLLRLGEQFGK